MEGAAVISARRFYRNASLWVDLVPTMEHVVRWLNRNATTVGWPVATMGGEVANNAYIAEAAFAIHAAGLPFETALNGDALDGVIAQLRDMGHDTPGDGNLDETERREVFLLASNLALMTSSLENPEYWPSIPGCGYVDSAHADIRDGSTLYEVKTVTRPFRSVDVRQLMTYSAMLHASGDPVARCGLINPRRGRAVSFSVEFVAQGASGLAAAECCRRISERMNLLGLEVATMF